PSVNRPSDSLTDTTSSGRGAGARVLLPSGASYSAPWSGHRRFSPSTTWTFPPWCVQRAEQATNSPGAGCATITFSPPASTCLAVPTGTSAVGRDASGTEVVDWAVDAGSGGSVIPHAERIPGSTTTPGSAARTARRCVHGPTVVGGASRG